MRFLRRFRPFRPWWRRLLLPALVLVVTASTPAAAADPPTMPGSGAARSSNEMKGGWGWPLAGRPRVTRAFDPPANPYGPGHRGVDLGGAPGEPVLAAGAGVVVFAGMLAGRGVVSVDHPGGLRTTYEPLAVAVRAGAAVDRGAVLGRLAAGHPGCSAPACLHWGLRRGPAYLDPLSLLRPRAVRLLPLTGPLGSRPRVGLPRTGPLGSRRGWACRVAGRAAHARGWAWRNAARRRSTETCV
jgi:murein DD-endopeptidase MepM/ murein hydrolase activator NlpD